MDASVAPAGSTSGVAPTITGQGLGAKTGYGGWGGAGVVAEGTAPLSYQWYRGERGDISDPIDGATTSYYTTPPLTAWAQCWVCVSNAVGSVDSETVLFEVIGGTMTFVQWTAQMGKVGAGYVPVGKRGALNTPLDDGVSNLMKFALGVPPMESAGANLPVATTFTAPGESLALALVFAKNTQGQGVRYALEASSDLSSWYEVESTTDLLGANPDGTELVRLREIAPPAGPAARFALLKVVLAP